MSFGKFRQRAAVGCALIVAASAPAARAGYLTLYSGNTNQNTTALNTPIAEQYAVLDRLSGASTPGDVFGTGFAGFDTAGSVPLDTSARYLYLVQSINAATSGSKMTTNLGEGGDGLQRFRDVTSIGVWNLTLADNAGPVSATNDFGTDGVAFTPNAPFNAGVTSPKVQSPTVTLQPTTLTTSTPDQIVFSFALANGQISQLMGYTTDLPPEIVLGTQATSTVADGANPAPVGVPEPSMAATLAAGALCLVRRRRRPARVA